MHFGVPRKVWIGPRGRELLGPLLDAHLEDIKPVVQAGGSDTASLDNVFELLVRGGREVIMVSSGAIAEGMKRLG